MTIIWLALTVLLSLLAANLYQLSREQDELIARQNACLARQNRLLDDDTVLIARLRAQAAHATVQDVPSFLGPSGPITLN